MTVRKTIKRELFVERLNHALRYGRLTDRERLLIASFAEGILVKGETYKGFNYQQSELTSEGTLKVGYNHSKRVYY